MPIKTGLCPPNLTQYTNNMTEKQKATDSLGTPSKRACKALTLAEKVKAIHAVENGQSHRQVAIDLNVGRTQTT